MTALPKFKLLPDEIEAIVNKDEDGNRIKHYERVRRLTRALNRAMNVLAAVGAMEKPNDQ